MGSPPSGLRTVEPGERKAVVVAPQGSRWLIDGNNVMGSRPDGWWRDRPGAARRLVAEVASHPWPDGSEVVVIFDGPEPAAGAGPEGDGAGTGEAVSDPVGVIYAGHGRSADDRIVEALRHWGPPVTVVTSDRGLADRVRALGAEVVSAGQLLARIRPETGPRR